MSELSQNDRHLRALELWRGREEREEDPPSLMELIRAAYPDQEGLDGRTKEARELKQYLSTLDIRADGAHVYKPIKIDLTNENKEFIENNASLMSAVHIARTLFNDLSLSNLNAETKAVQEHIEQINPQIFHQEETATSLYTPPNTFDKALKKVNRYIFEKIDKSKINSKQKNNINALLGYLNTFRFIQQANTYEATNHRELFESSFVRYTNDKPDLTAEEVDQYIVLSTEVVIGFMIQARSERLQAFLDTAADDTEGRRIAMGLVQAISSAQTEYNQCVTRQQKLLEHLKEKRSDKLRKEIKDNASIINLVQLWKDEESRLKLIKLAELRKKVVRKEMDNLAGMDELKARIMGISQDEVSNG
jgi:general stress protein 26